jgi:hypothetical protein
MYHPLLDTPDDPRSDEAPPPRPMAAAAQTAAEPGQVPDVSNDEALAAALALEFEEEARLDAERMEEADEAELASPPPGIMPPPPAEAQQAAPGAARSMLSRLVASITGGGESEEAAAEQHERRRRLELQIPEGAQLTGEFVVQLPDGGCEAYGLDPALAPGDWVVALFDGPELAPARARSFDAEAALDFYRFHPGEVECEGVPLALGARALGGAELVQRPEGVFVRWGVGGEDSGLRAGDLVVAVAGEARLPRRAGGRADAGGEVCRRWRRCRAWRGS